MSRVGKASESFYCWIEACLSGKKMSQPPRVFKLEGIHAAVVLLLLFAARITPVNSIQPPTPPSASPHACRSSSQTSLAASLVAIIDQLRGIQHHHIICPDLFPHVTALRRVLSEVFPETNVTATTTTSSTRRSRVHVRNDLVQSALNRNDYALTNKVTLAARLSDEHFGTPNGVWAAEARGVAATLAVERHGAVRDRGHPRSSTSSQRQSLSRYNTFSDIDAQPLPSTKLSLPSSQIHLQAAPVGPVRLPFVFADSSSVDRQLEVLSDLYLSTSGSGWFVSDGWLTSTPVCSWFGVGCDASGRVTSLSLAYNNLLGTLPSSLSLLAHLDLLSFTHNGITGSLAPEWSALPLSSFDAANCYLRGELPLSWRSMPLQTLDLGWNFLSGSLPSLWAELNSLLSLTLQGNLLSGELPEAWSQMNLLSLDVSYNFISGTLPVSWGSLPALQALSLFGTLLSGTLPDFLSQVSTLQILQLQQSPVSGTLPSSWANFSALSVLSLSATAVSGTLPPSWASFSSLRLLDLRGCQLSGLLPEAWSASQLQYLDMSSNLISGPLPPSWANLPQPLELNLAGNLLSGELPHSWAALAVRQLNLSGNQLSGTLPSSWPPTGCAVLDLRSNFFSGPLSLGPSPVLNAVFLSGNNLSASLAPFLLSTVIMYPALRVLHLSDMLLNDLHLSDVNTSSPLSSLHTLDISENRGLQGDAVAWMDFFGRYIPGLISLDASNCGWSFPFPALLFNHSLSVLTTLRLARNVLIPKFVVSVSLASPLPNLQTLDITDAGLLASEFVTFLAISNDDRYYDSEIDAFCYRRRAYFFPNTLLITNSFVFDYRACTCDRNADNGLSQYFAWHLFPNPVCRACPEGALCTGAAPHLPMAAADHYPLSGPVVGLVVVAYSTFVPAFIKCRVAGACQPQPAVAFAQLLQTPVQLSPTFECAAGRDPTSFLCSQCLPNHFEGGSASPECTQCAAWYTWAVPILDVLAVVLIVRGLWLQVTSSSPPTEVIRITLFWLQLQPIIQTSVSFQGAKSTVPSWLLSGPLEDIVSFRPWAIDCLGFRFDLVAHFWSLMCLLALLLLLYSLVRHENFRQLVLSLLYLLYLPITTAILQVFSCDSRYHFLNAAPSLSCSSDAVIAMRAVGGILIPFWVIGWPIFDAWQLWKAPENSRILSTYRDPVRHWHWNVSVVTLRKLVLALFITLLPYDSSLIPLFTLWVLLLSIGLHIREHPYKGRDNTLETVLISEAVFAFLGGVLSTNLSSSNTLLIILFVANFTTRMFAYVVLLNELRGPVTRGLRSVQGVVRRVFSDKHLLRSSSLEMDAKPVLPPSDWEQYATEDGVPYFHNHRTLVSQWRRPADLALPENLTQTEVSVTTTPPRAPSPDLSDAETNNRI